MPRRRKRISNKEGLFVNTCRDLLFIKRDGANPPEKVQRRRNTCIVTGVSLSLRGPTQGGKKKKGTGP